jgi:hypothetical protein
VLVPTPDDARLRCDLLLALGDVQRRAGIATYRDTVAQAVATARALADGERLALAVLTNARPGGLFASANAVDAELIALYEEAAAALGGADSLLRARLLGQLAVELVHTQDRDRRDALSHEAIAIARRLGDRSGLAQVLVLRLYAINDPFTLAERLGLIAELTELASELGSSELGWHAANHRSGALLESGDIAGAERALSETERLAGALRQPYSMRGSPGWGGRCSPSCAERQTPKHRLCRRSSSVRPRDSRTPPPLSGPSSRTSGTTPAVASSSSTRRKRPSRPSRTTRRGEPSWRVPTARSIDPPRRESRSTSSDGTASVFFRTGCGPPTWCA